MKLVARARLELLSLVAEVVLMDNFSLLLGGAAGLGDTLDTLCLLCASPGIDHASPCKRPPPIVLKVWVFLF